MANRTYKCICGPKTIESQLDWDGPCIQTIRCPFCGESLTILVGPTQDGEEVMWGKIVYRVYAMAAVRHDECPATTIGIKGALVQAWEADYM